MPFISRPLTVALGLSVCGLSGFLLYIYFFKKDDEDDYLDPLYKASNYKIHRMTIPSEMIKVLIGRNGKKIKEIEEQTQTKINFKKLDNKQSLCEIHGAKESCNLAKNLISLFLQNQPILECEDILIPGNCCGKIIGRDGDKIREISSLSGAKITIDNKRNSNQRRCTIKGTKEQITVAKSLIEEILDDYKKQQMNMEQRLAKREPRLPPKNNIDSPKCERMSPVPGQPETQFEVYVSAMIDPSRFWLQIVGPKATELDVLVDEMSEYYKKQENKDNHVLQGVNKGDLVAAIFKYDNKWYRAEVLNISDDGKIAELYYVDYGDIDQADVKELYELRTDFLRLHFQAIECFLAKVEPVGEKWSVAAIDKFEEWTHVGQWKKLSAKINGYSAREKTRAKRDGSPVPGVDLFDVSNEQDIDIAQELVNYGYAIYKKDCDLRSNSRTTSTSNISIASSS